MDEPKRKTIARNPSLWLIAALVLIAAIAFFVRLIVLNGASAADTAVIRYGDGNELRIRLDDPQTIVIRDGKLVSEAIGEGEENEIVVEAGGIRMESANCRGNDCVKQGVLSSKTVSRRPLGSWIICAPHRVSIELVEGAP